MKSTFAMAVILLVGTASRSALRLEQDSLTLTVGNAQQLQLTGDQPQDAQWSSTDPKVVEVFKNGFVVGLRAGTARVHIKSAAGSAQCAVTVTKPREKPIDPATLQQYDDNRAFKVDGRECFGSELNGRRATSAEEKKFTDSNRVINPNPLSAEHPLEWAVEDDTEVYDGCGVLMGTVAPKREVRGRKVPVSMFNFGMSNILGGHVCLYAFAVTIRPDKAIRGMMDPQEFKDGAGDTSAWLPLDRVIDKESLLERIGLGKVKLPPLPLETKGLRITGGDDKQYMTQFGEMRIVKDPDAAPVPSHYLRRPSGTVNIIYSVPGFSLGGQGMDAFLITDNALFYPAKGAKVFVQPTYFPGKHPKAGEMTEKTMTFIYGAVKVKESETVYGWVAKEALAPAGK